MEQHVVVDKECGRREVNVALNAAEGRGVFAGAVAETVHRHGVFLLSLYVAETHGAQITVVRKYVHHGMMVRWRRAHHVLCH